MITMRLLPGVLLLMTSAIAVQAALVPQRLQCENRDNPLGIDAASPRLSWIARAVDPKERGQMQTAWRAIVASSPEILARDQGDLWDSGDVASSQSIQIAYRGGPLVSAQRCWWKVRIADKSGQWSPWSEAAWWEMGLLEPEDWKAKWIDDGKPLPARDEDFYADDPAPLFRREFAARGPVKRARLYVSGLGYYEARLNGERIGDSLLDPGWTSYTKRVFYSVYDVTDRIRPGANCLGAMLGNGWFNPLPLRMWGGLDIRKSLTVERPRLIAQLRLDYADGSSEWTATGPDWKTAPGPIIRNSVYLGEMYDARRELAGWDAPGFDAAGWASSALAGPPQLGPLRAQPQPPIRQTAALKPVRVTEPSPRAFIFDLGQNFAGIARLRIKGDAGTTITLRYGELLNPDGTLNARTGCCGQIKPGGASGGPGAPAAAEQCDTYILRGAPEGETYSPRFTFHGFRYIELRGYPGQGAPAPETIEGLRLNADVEPCGVFECSDPLLNQIQKNTQWTFLSNLFSVQSDCPHRERLGYGGDIIPTAEAFIYNFDMARFYAKVAGDFADAARPSGALTETAPFVGIADQGFGEGSGPIGWAIAHPFLVHCLYRYYGDRRIIEEQYETARRSLEFLRLHASNHIIDHCIGDHESLDPKFEPLTATAHYYLHASLTAEFARILEKADDALRYEELARSIKTAFIAKFLDPKTARFGPGGQTCQAVALAYDLVPPEKRSQALDLLVRAVMEDHKGHPATGIFGARLVPQVLSEMGRSEIAWNFTTAEGFPGWKYMIEKGATTLWEHWTLEENVFSHNHPMFGSISTWFFETPGGIQPAPGAIGFDHIIIRPEILGDLKWAKARYNSVRGTVACEWKRDGAALEINVVIPVGASAEIYLPASRPGSIFEGGVPAEKATGLKFLRVEGGKSVFLAQSGSYEFHIRQVVSR